MEHFELYIRIEKFKLYGFAKDNVWNEIVMGSKTSWSFCEMLNFMNKLAQKLSWILSYVWIYTLQHKILQPFNMYFCRISSFQDLNIFLFWWKDETLSVCSWETSLGFWHMLSYYLSFELPLKVKDCLSWQLGKTKSFVFWSSGEWFWRNTCQTFDHLTPGDTMNK